MDDVLSDLRQALGFHVVDGSQEQVAQPYVEYIKTSWTGRGEQQDFLRFFIEVVRHFRGMSIFRPPSLLILMRRTRPLSDRDPVNMDLFIISKHEMDPEHTQSEVLTEILTRNPPGRTTPAGSSIQEYLNSLIKHQDHYYFKDTMANSSARGSGVNETVLLILGTWLLSQSYFVPTHQDQRRIVYAYCRSTDQVYSESKAFEQSVGTLMLRSGLLPSAGEGRGALDDDASSFQVVDEADIAEAFPLHSYANLLESLTIDSKRLNATNLSTYGHIEIAWTQNISRHMLLSKRAESYYLEIFALPCALQGGADHALNSMGISTDLMDEIECSYAALFNPSPESNLHKTLAWVVGLHRWCWCLHCTARRFRKHVLKTFKETRHRRRERLLGTGHRVIYDDQIRVLMERNAAQWNQTEFSNLWPRILVLDSHLQRARPWNFWVLFRDRRDTVQYWTFL